jgi:hypothetical protein
MVFINIPRHKKGLSYLDSVDRLRDNGPEASIAIEESIADKN